MKNYNIFLNCVLFFIYLSCSSSSTIEQITEKYSHNEIKPETESISEPIVIPDTISCQSNIEICNYLDDDCNGKIDDISPIECIPQNVTRVCSKGIRRCEEGKLTLCSDAILPLSPSCLDVEDLDCDKIPDTANFGRKTKEQELFPISTDFKILSYVNVSNQTYIMVVRDQENSTYLDILDVQNNFTLLVSLRKDSLWHSELKNITTLGKIFEIDSKNILAGYCIIINNKKECKIHLINIQQKTFVALTLPSLSEKQEYVDFIYFQGTLGFLLFNQSLLEKNKTGNVSASVAFYFFNKEQMSIQEANIPSIHLLLHINSIRNSNPLQYILLSENLSFLTIFTEIEVSENTINRLILIYQFEKTIWNKYSFSSDMLIGLVGSPLIVNNQQIVFPYQFSPVKIASLEMNWEIGKLIFNVTNKSWQKESLTTVNGTIRIRAILQQQNSIFSVSRTTCNNSPNSLTIYNFSYDKNVFEKYLFSTRSNPRDIVLTKVNNHFSIIWLSGNEQLCGWKNEKNKLHRLEFGNCK